MRAWIALLIAQVLVLLGAVAYATFTYEAPLPTTFNIVAEPEAGLVPAPAYLDFGDVAQGYRSGYEEFRITNTSDQDYRRLLLDVPEGLPGSIRYYYGYTPASIPPGKQWRVWLQLDVTEEMPLGPGNITFRLRGE